jgi:hypothetical protein
MLRDAFKRRAARALPARTAGGARTRRMERKGCVLDAGDARQRASNAVHERG